MAEAIPIIGVGTTDTSGNAVTALAVGGSYRLCVDASAQIPADAAITPSCSSSASVTFTGQWTIEANGTSCWTGFTVNSTPAGGSMTLTATSQNSMTTGALRVGAQ